MGAYPVEVIFCRAASMHDRGPTMISKFDSLFAGHTDLENCGYAGTPINERRYDNKQLATALFKAEAMAQMMDRNGYDTFWMAEHHFQREGTECLPNVLMMASAEAS
jgi:hypothetical protein